MSREKFQRKQEIEIVEQEYRVSVDIHPSSHVGAAQHLKTKQGWFERGLRLLLVSSAIFEHSPM